MAALCGPEEAQASGGKKEKAPKEEGVRRQQCAWSGQLSKAGSARELAEIVREHGAGFDKMNLACALHRLARRAPFPAGAAEGAWAAVRLCVVRADVDGLKGYSAQGVANICWALARLGFRQASWTGVAEETAGPLGEEAEYAPPEGHSAGLAPGTDSATQEVAARVYRLAAGRACADLRWAAETGWSEVSTWTADWAGSGLWGGWKPQELANLCWALARAGSRAGGAAVRRLFGLVAQGALVSKWKGFSSQELVSVLSALSGAGLAPPPLIRRTLAKALKHLGMFQLQELCLVLLAAARTPDTTWAEVRPLMCAALAAAVEAKLEGYNPVDLANLAWALGAFQARRHEHEARGLKGQEGGEEDANAARTCDAFVAQTVAAARAKLDSWSPVEIASLVCSLSRLEVLDKGLVQKACKRWRAWLEEPAPPAGAAQPQAMANFALGAARLGHVDCELLAAFCRRLRAALRQGGGGWTGQNATNVLWAASCMLGLASAERERLEEKLDEAALAEMEGLGPRGLDELRELLRASLKTVFSARKGNVLALDGGRGLSILYLTHLALRASAVGRGGCEDREEWSPPPEVVTEWRAAYDRDAAGLTATELHAKRSGFHKSVCKALWKALPEVYPEGSRLCNEADREGLRVDVLVIPPCDLGCVAIEVDGPRHFVRLSAALEPASAAGCAKAQAPRLNGQSQLKHWLLRRLARVAPVSVAHHVWADHAKRRQALVDALRAGADEAAEAKAREGSQAPAEAQGPAEPQAPDEAASSGRKRKHAEADASDVARGGAGEAKAEAPDEADASDAARGGAGEAKQVVRAPARRGRKRKPERLPPGRRRAVLSPRTPGQP